MTALRVVGNVAAALLVVAYPFGVYYGLTHWSARRAGVLVVSLFAAVTLLNLKSARRADLWALLRIPLAVVLLVGVGSALNSPRFFLFLPVLVNVVFLHGFASSLWDETPLVERFARLQEPDLTDAERVYCRTVTRVWSGYFVVNIAITVALALFAPLDWWTVYTGVVAYVAMGALFTVEYLTRKYRFRRFGPHLHDRVLEKLLPARRGDDG